MKTGKGITGREISNLGTGTRITGRFTAIWEQVKLSREEIQEHGNK
jgi:hypothetical protein